MSVGDVLNLKKYRVRFRCYVFQYHAFPLLLFFFSIIGLHYKPVPHFSEFCFFFRLDNQPTSRCPGNETASPRKYPSRCGRRPDPKEWRKSSLFFVTHSIFRFSGSAWSTPLSSVRRGLLMTLRKRKTRGARWEGERLLLFLLGYPGGAAGDERIFSVALSRWLWFLSKIWC